ncbi:prepilin-type N-terminal cleavage/methylation domain-containing protein [Patescibacteria group bacterium]
MVRKVVCKRNSLGFTLIELLIVIVIIGILSMVLITIIEPETQMNRARDGAVIASMNKMVLSTNSFITAYNRVPDETSFFLSLKDKGRELFGDECSHVFSPDYECILSIQGADLPNTCNLTYWTGSVLDNQPCSFRYQGRIMNDSQRYRIYVKSHGIPDTLFVYDNVESGKLFECPHTIADFENLTGNCSSN